jgi:hypothetical protein
MAWAPDYITLAQLKGYMRVTDSDDDAELSTAISGASRAIDLATGRQFGQVAAAEDRYYEAVWDIATGRWVVAIDDVSDLTGFTLAIDPAGDESFTGTITDYVFYPRNAVAKGMVYTKVAISRASAVQPLCKAQAVKGHAKWGWPAFPTVVQQACKLQSSRLAMRRESTFGVAGSPSNGGSELRLLAKLDPDVDVMLRSVNRNWGAV